MLEIWMEMYFDSETEACMCVLGLCVPQLWLTHKVGWGGRGAILVIKEMKWGVKSTEGDRFL